MNNIHLLSLPDTPIHRREVLRYASAGKQGDLPLLEECIKEAKSSCSVRVCYRILSVQPTRQGVRLGSFHLPSLQLKQNLEGCEEAVLFAATIGLGIDRLIRKYTLVSPAKALLFQALGAERIESGCNLFEEWLSEHLPEGTSLHPRFSPGYGDLPLTFQKDLFACLECEKKLGLSLNENLLISPTKSVTAVIGLEKRSCQ